MLDRILPADALYEATAAEQIPICGVDGPRRRPPPPGLDGRPDEALRDAILGEPLATTNQWYARLCNSAARTGTAPYSAT